MNKKYIQGDTIPCAITITNTEGELVTGITSAKAVVLIYNQKQAPLYNTATNTMAHANSVLTFEITAAESQVMPVGLIEVELEFIVGTKKNKRREVVGYLQKTKIEAV